MKETIYKITSLLLAVALVISMYNNHNSVKAVNSIQSQGKIVYNPGDGNDAVIIDTGDHEVLKDGITANAVNINQNRSDINAHTNKILSFDEFIEQKNITDVNQDNNISEIQQQSQDLKNNYGELENNYSDLVDDVNQLNANKIAQVGIKHIVYFEPYPMEEAKKY